MNSKYPLEKHYQTLGLQPGASSVDIRAAYRRMAKIHHPDANPDDPASEELFKKVADAYRILSNPASRARYDKATRHPPSPEDKGRQPDSESSRGNSLNITVRLHLSLEQAVRGGHKELRIPRKIPCPACDGGSRETARGCNSCGDTGIVLKTTYVDAVYPPGVRTGSRLKFAAFGHRLPPDNFSGDLLIEISLKPDRYFDIQGSDLYYRALIGLDLFIEGGSLKIPTPGGATSVEIPPRMSDGRVLKIAGKGLPACKEAPEGDLYLKFDLCVPKRLSRKERQLLGELMAHPGFQPPADADGFIPRGD